MKKIILILASITSTLIFDLNFVFANEIENQLNNDISNIPRTKEFENQNTEKIIISNSSDKELFGDEQAFPFIAGLGKNAAH